MTCLSVYAILRRAPRGRLGRGVQGEALVARRVRDLVVVVGEVSAPPRVDEANLRAHDALVRSIAARADAVLPMRFGAVSEGVRPLVSLVDARHDELADRLATVAGCEQFTLRVFVDGPRAVAQKSEDGPGARYLRTRAALALPPEIAELRAAVAPRVREERAEAHQAPPLVASVYHLVAMCDSARYRADLARGLRATRGARVAVSGPWPAYAFAESA